MNISTQVNRSSDVAPIGQNAADSSDGTESLLNRAGRNSTQPYARVSQTGADNNLRGAVEGQSSLEDINRSNGPFNKGFIALADEAMKNKDLDTLDELVSFAENAMESNDSSCIEEMNTQFLAIAHYALRHDNVGLALKAAGATKNKTRDQDWIVCDILVMGLNKKSDYANALKMFATVNDPSRQTQWLKHIVWHCLVDDGKQSKPADSNMHKNTIHELKTDYMQFALKARELLVNDEHSFFQVSGNLAEHYLDFKQDDDKAFELVQSIPSSFCRGSQDIKTSTLRKLFNNSAERSNLKRCQEIAREMPDPIDQQLYRIKCTKLMPSTFVKSFEKFFSIR